MARLKVRFRFNPGGSGAPMDRLGVFASQTERFLRSFAHDMGFEAKKGTWLARNFTNESVAFDGEFEGAPIETDALIARGLLAGIFGDNPVGVIGKHVSYGTIAEYSKIGEALEPGQHFFAGVYDLDSVRDPNEVEMYEVSYKKTAEIRALLSAPMITHGAIQGIMHAWHYGADPTFFTLRPVSGGELVRCEYPKSMHHDIHAATEKPTAVLIVEGKIHWDRATNAVIRVVVESAPSVSAPLTESEFNGIFGSAPAFTGTMTTSEYIDWVRGDGD